MSKKSEVTMNFVGYNKDVMAQTNSGNLLKLFLCPNTSSRVMRVAQQEKAYLVFYDFLFKISIVHDKMALRGFNKGGDHKGATVI